MLVGRGSWGSHQTREWHSHCGGRGGLGGYTRQRSGIVIAGGKGKFKVAVRSLKIGEVTINILKSSTEERP